MIPALLVVWILDPARKSRIPHYVLGLSGPVLAAAWEFDQGWQHPNWAAEFLLYRQELFLLSQPFFVQLPWRVTVVVEYTALWLVPLVLLAAWRAGHEAFAGPRRPEVAADRAGGSVAGLIACIAFFGGTLAYGAKIVGWSYNAQFGGSPALDAVNRPVVRFLWRLPDGIRWGITLFVLVGAGLFLRIGIARYGAASRGLLKPSHWVLDLTTLFSLAFTLGFNQFIDRYFLIYLPYVAIIVGKRLEGCAARLAPGGDRLLRPVACRLGRVDARRSRERAGPVDIIRTSPQRRNSAGPDLLRLEVALLLAVRGCCSRGFHLVHIDLCGSRSGGIGSAASAKRPTTGSFAT